MPLLMGAGVAVSASGSSAGPSNPNPAGLSLDPVADQMGLEETANAISITGITIIPSLSVAVRADVPGLFSSLTIRSPDAAGNSQIDYRPAPQQFGSAQITVMVAQKNSHFDESFTLAIQAVNDPPTLSPIADLSGPEDTVLRTPPSRSLQGRVTKAVRPSGSTARDPRIFRFLIVEGSGTSRTLAFEPLPDVFGRR